MKWLPPKAWLPPKVGVPIAVACALGAVPLYVMASKRKGRKKAAPLAGGIVLTLLAILVPVLSFDVVRKIKARKLKPGNAVKNGTAPGAVIFS